MSVATVDDRDGDGDGDGDVTLTLPQRPSYDIVSRAARRAVLVGVDKVRVVKVPAGLVRLAEATIDRSPLVAYLESLLPAQENRPTGGRVRVLNVRSVLVSLLLLGLTEQAMIVRDAVAVLNALHPSTKHRLGVPQRCEDGSGGVTERMLSRLFNQIAAALDPSPDTPRNHADRQRRHQAIRDAHPGPEHRDLRRTQHELVEAGFAEHLLEKLHQLRYVLDRGMDATLPDAEHTGSYAVDGSEVHSWSHQFHKQPKAPALISDPDARWNAKGDGWFGYWLHGVVRARETDGPDAPCLTERFELTAANFDSRVAGLELIHRMTADHEAADAARHRPDRPRRTMLADPAYTSEVHASRDWLWPLFALGFDSTHKLTKSQLGVGRNTLSNGALVVDGQPYSPRLPLHLRNLTPPEVKSTRAEIEAYQALIAQRVPFMLHPIGGRHDDGSWDFGCKAMSALGALRCDLKPASMAKPAKPTRPTTDPRCSARGSCRRSVGSRSPASR